MSEDRKGEKPDILERTIAYSLRIIRLYRDLEKDNVGRIIGKQLLRSGTSIGANVHEAQGGQSKADFIAKMSIANKEARESAYWIRLIKKAELVPENRIRDLYDETDQIIRILSSILITAKKRK
ncbi:MAG: four helix bundle protein [Desulfobacteraceae bacterium]|uniref:Four helix bundle protein n=1 Tax=Candidatus Desulfacyla euxinica TaxID=2841693 RepID=A0A8J6N3A1_9DELT|nr:four helix bundle protein [Candidatus Desulfacyla euxinica]MBL6977614.1 four helix bundle protein [Desulfobacteraceae bacterium]MBL7216201.1 four helix bundle protein [Desulfobacteraceae bacterium]